MDAYLYFTCGSMTLLSCRLVGAGAHVVELFRARGDGQVEVAEAKFETFSWYLVSCFLNVEILTSITQGMHEPRRRTIYLQKRHGCPTNKI